MKKIIIFFMFFIFISNVSSAIKSMSLGGVETIIYSEAENVSINPSGLVGLKNMVFSFEFSPILVGVNNGNIYNGSLYFAYPTKRFGSLGVCVEYLNVGISDTSSLYRDLTFKFSYGFNIIKKFDYGFSFKINKWKVDSSAFATSEVSYSKISFDFDLSVVSYLNNNLLLGIVLLNILDSNQDILSSDEEVNFRGIKVGLQLAKTKENLFGVEMEYTDSFKLSLGGQFVFNKNIYFRSGIKLNNFLYGINLTFGTGYKFYFSKLDKNLEINYALDYPLYFGYLGTHSIGISFNL